MPHGDGDDQDLEHVERQAHRAVVAGTALEAEDVGRDQAGQEVEPGPGGRGGRRGVRGDAGVVTRLEHQAERDADRHGDQGGDREPRQGLPRQAGGAGDVTQVGDRRDDREEDQRRDDRAQQGDEDVAHGGEGLGQPVGVGHAGGVDRVGTHGAGDEAEDDTQREPDQDLDAEGREAEATGGSLRLGN